MQPSSAAVTPLGRKSMRHRDATTRDPRPRPQTSKSGDIPFKERALLCRCHIAWNGRRASRTVHRDVETPARNLLSWLRYPLGIGVAVKAKCRAPQTIPPQEPARGQRSPRNHNSLLPPGTTFAQIFSRLLPWLVCLCSLNRHEAAAAPGIRRDVCSLAETSRRAEGCA